MYKIGFCKKFSSNITFLLIFGKSGSVGSVEKKIKYLIALKYLINSCPIVFQFIKNIPFHNKRLKDPCIHQSAH